MVNITIGFETECSTKPGISKLQPFERALDSANNIFNLLKTSYLAPQVGFEPTTLRLTAT